MNGNELLKVHVNDDFNAIFFLLSHIKENGNSLAYRFGRFDVLAQARAPEVPIKIINERKTKSDEVD